MRLTAGLLCLCLSIAPAVAGGETIVSGGIARQYEIFRPASQRGPVPAVILLHGAGGTGAQLERFTDFDRVAAAAGISRSIRRGLAVTGTTIVVWACSPMPMTGNSC